MADTLFETIENFGLLPPLLSKKGRFVVDDTYGVALLFTTLYKKKKDDYAIVCSNLYNAQKVYELLLNFLEEEEVVFVPNDEVLRAQYLSSGKEILAQRLYALGELTFHPKRIVVTCPSALLRYLPSPSLYREQCIQINVGSSFDMTELIKKLISIGYERVNKIEHSLQFATRGDILDVFSVNYDNPIRFEFYGDEVDSIRSFKIVDQISIDRLDEATILPATDLFLSEDEVSNLVMKGKEQLEKDKKFLCLSAGNDLENNFAIEIEDYLNHNYKESFYKYFGYGQINHYSILDYFNPKIIFITNKEQFLSSTSILRTDAQNYLEEQTTGGLCISHLEYYQQLEEAIKVKQNLVYSESFAASNSDTVFKVRGIVSTGKSLNNVITTLDTYLHTCNKVVISLNEPHQEEVIKGILKENKIEFEEVEGFDLPHGVLGFRSGNLSEGFELVDLKIAYISASDLLGKNPANSRYSSRFKNATILLSYEDLKVGDYVVHEYYGIGQYLGNKIIESKGIHRDYLTIGYAKNETLYIPLEQFRLVRKFSGREGAAPKLSHLSTGDWEKKKKTIKERVKQLADNLYQLYEDRAKLTGFAFKPDDELQEEFEKEFPYPLTEDQEKSLQEIKEDMEKPLIMDRLLCGDVGFGKTEVAFRAAFKAINNGKQVALLCPTTLLARQHYELALRRFGAFGVRIAVFSRLIPNSVQKENIKKIKEGQIDLIIGTHRLLSKEIEYKDLGLLIVDEEQRFGVGQKEKIKVMKRSLDVLTLSATPIPRTLQMSLVGMRQLSQINTAPGERMPVQTYVTPYKEEVVDELIQRELGRNGQVFYVYNRVEFIYKKASEIASRVKSATVGVVHGQMDKADIEEVMSAFYDGKLNVLVASSIIENGIDIPNANMIIVEDADHFGLSQLYQIKGRVGRGNRIAYAYLMYKEQKSLNEDAQKRLQAIQEFTDLGSGYKIAQRDLMIRGAGDILGPEQAGFIDTVGLDLYLKMLNEAVEEKKTGLPTPTPKPAKVFLLDAYIPNEYANSSEKLQLYQELDALENAKDIKKFENKIRDIYGRIPTETKLLIQKKRISLILLNDEFSTIDDDQNKVDLQLSNQFSSISSIGQDLFSGLINYMNIIQVSFLNKKLRMIIKKTDRWLDDLEEILNVIHKLYLSRMNNDLKRMC